VKLVHDGGMKKLALAMLVLVGCGDLSTSTTVEPSGPCIDGYERKDYYPRDAVWCGPVGDAGWSPATTTANPCQGGRPVSFAGQGVVMCEFD
jgi:hypothetical protein